MGRDHLERFGPFELERRIGAGGMAETFAATRRGPGSFEQRVCVKRILPSWQGDARFVAMFLEEARIAARLRHATIVQVIEAGEVEGAPYLVLELIDGVDLRRLIDGQGPLAPELVALVALELATALEIAHRDGVIHRDVSPSNVLVSAAGEVKLADFGIAKAHDSAPSTATGLPKGKASYMAPEYAASARATPATDVYALGVTLFEAATGKKPFVGKTELATFLGARASRAPLRTIARALPGSLADAIDRALEPEPGARFAGADRFFDAISDVTPAPGARRRLGALVRAVHDAATIVDRTLDRTVPRAAPQEAPTRAARATRR